MDYIKEIYQRYLQSTGVSTDTRSIVEGQIFFALKGDRFDGNKHALKAIENGAFFCVVDDHALEYNEQFIFVDDVLSCLQQLATHHRSQFDIPIIGITGSNGKTTTKELLAAVLSKKFKVHFTQGNFNNHIGVPLTLLSAKSGTELMIIEMGANHIGEIALLCKIALPNAGLITNIGRAHLEGFGGVEGVIKGKTELYKHLHQYNGEAFVNMDDPILVENSSLLKNLNHYSINDYHLNYDKDGCIQLVNETHRYVTQLVGDYNLPNVAAAIAVAERFGVDQADIHSAIAEYKPSINRSERKEKNGNVYILDAYNANPSSMKESIISFSKLKGEKRLILGEMLEMGDYSATEHQNLVTLVQLFDWSSVWLVGKGFKSIDIEDNMRYFDDITSLNQWKQTQNFDANQLYLLKGSRGVKLERFIDLTE